MRLQKLATEKLWVSFDTKSENVWGVTTSSPLSPIGKRGREFQSILRGFTSNLGGCLGKLPEHSQAICLEHMHTLSQANLVRLCVVSKLVV